MFPVRSMMYGNCAHLHQNSCQEFQENQEDYGFLSVKCFSTDRPNFDSLEQARVFLSIAGKSFFSMKALKS